MPDRNNNLQRFIDATKACIQAQAAFFPDAMPMADRIFAALNKAADIKAEGAPTRLAVCRYLERALSQARNGPDPVPELANAFAAIEPEFAWNRRPGSELEYEDFHDGHANAIIVGNGGLEVRQDVRIGVSLVAPDIHYTRHRHLPEELYVVLSPGKWMQDDYSLTFRRSGDLVHNVPNVWHAMQATKVPLLAIWCLWVKE